MGRKFRDDNILKSLNPSKLEKIFDFLVRIVNLVKTKKNTKFRSPILKAVPWDMEAKTWVNPKEYEAEHKIALKKYEKLSKDRA